MVEEIKYFENSPLPKGRPNTMNKSGVSLTPNSIIFFYIVKNVLVRTVIFVLSMCDSRNMVKLLEFLVIIKLLPSIKKFALLCTSRSTPVEHNLQFINYFIVDEKLLARDNF